jgi:membrane-associated phospholipid phosphatase
MTALDSDRPPMPGAYVAPQSEPDRLHVRWPWLAGSFLFALLIGVGVASGVRSHGGWERGLAWERALLMQVHAHELPKAMDLLFLTIPWLGTNWTLVPLVVGPALWLWLRKRRRMLALHLLTVLVGGSALNFVLKFAYDRPRPDLWERRGQWQFASYPSGHSISSVAVLFTVAMLLQRFKGWIWPWFVAVLILGFSLYSRLYLGVHWPTDVASGYAMGTVWLAGTLIAFTERRWRGPRDEIVQHI